MLMRSETRSLDVLLPDGSDAAAATAGILGISHTARLAGALLPSTTSPTDHDTRSSFSRRWVADTNSTASRMPRMAHFYGQLTRHTHWIKRSSIGKYKYIFISTKTFLQKILQIRVNIL